MWREAHVHGELLACSFCTAVYHNTTPCALTSVVAAPFATAPSFPWTCAPCLKKGIAAVQRAVLKPTVQRAAGAKKPRRKRARK